MFVDICVAMCWYLLKIVDLCRYLLILCLDLLIVVASWLYLLLVVDLCFIFVEIVWSLSILVIFVAGSLYLLLCVDRYCYLLQVVDVCCYLLLFVASCWYLLICIHIFIYCYLLICVDCCGSSLIFVGRLRSLLIVVDIRLRFNDAGRLVHYVCSFISMVFICFWWQLLLFADHCFFLLRPVDVCWYLWNLCLYSLIFMEYVFVFVDKYLLSLVDICWYLLLLVDCC
jgi:hypothetical protein